MLSFTDFLKFCRATPAEIKRPKPYLKAHSVRFYETYREALRLLPEGGSLLSVGAGRAFVECALAAKHNISVTVFDFPEMLASDQYAAFKFRTEAGNFITDDVERISGQYDAVLFCEIVEHIPIDPALQFVKLVQFLKPGGILLVTTPNIASASRCLQLLSGRNIIQPAHLLFSPVSAENAAVHRREYVLSEMVSAMKSAGLKIVTARFIGQGQGRLRPGSILYHSFIKLWARWRPMMLVAGRL